MLETLTLNCYSVMKTTATATIYDNKVNSLKWVRQQLNDDKKEAIASLAMYPTRKQIRVALFKFSRR